MRLEWLARHRDFVEKLVKFGNSYAQNYNTEYSYNTPVKFSAAQLQTLEYILEHEESNQNMAEIAARLGVTPSCFSKNVKKMMEKGLLEKYHISNNRKDVIVRASEQGRQVYAQYVQYAMESTFNDILAILDQVPQEYEDMFTRILTISAAATCQVTEPTLIKIQ